MRRRRLGGDGAALPLVRMPGLALVFMLLACVHVPLAGGARPPEVVLDPASRASGLTLRASYTEGNAPLRLTSDALLAGVEGGAPLVRAVVKIANPADAPLEFLGLTDAYSAWYAANGAPYADAPSDVALTKRTGPGVNIDVVASSAADQTSWTGRLTVTIRPQLGTLEIVAPLARGEELLDAMDAPTTHAIRDALRHVTYHHTGKRPDTATRGVSFEVVDADGGTSAPAAFLVDILSVNDAPTLDLNGLHRGGTGYSSTMGEHERVLGVALVDADLYVGDADGTLIVRGRVAYDPAGVGYSATDFPDGDAESVTLNLKGTSVTGTWDPASRAFELTGPDTVDAYRSILASARYVNTGKLFTIDTQRPPTKELGFTAGARRFTFEVQDVDGAVTRAVSEVLVSEVTRVGDPARDELQRTPKECSGAGYRDLDDELGTGDPETCVCDAGFEGDLCEIHPCGYRGTLVFLDPSTGEKTCDCDDKFSGDVCDVECGGNGKYDAATGGCVCHKGWTGFNCDARCDGCDGEFGTCSLTDFSASTWQPATQEYLLIDTVCTCTDDYLGANCTIPCPCAKGGFGKGTCAVDLAKLELDEYPDEELGICLCQDGYVGSDCTIPCPACVADQGTCQPPIGYEDGVGQTLVELSATFTGSTLALKIFEATVNGTCACDSSVENVFGGLGYAGDDCSVSCRPCDMGTCQPDGSCECFPGYSGWRCQDQCNGAGIILFPQFNETYTHADFDNLPLVPGNANYNQSGLFDVYELYGVSQTPTNDTWAYCACGYRRNAVSDEVEPIPFNELPFNAENGQGYTGPFCDVPCDPCLSTNGKCEYDGTRGVCDCFKDAPNSKGSESKLVQDGTKGYGFVGPSCFYPCEPCFNGTCSSEPGSYGQCVCNPGFSDPACLIECGDPGTAYAFREIEDTAFGMTIGQISAGEVYIGSRGVVNLTGAQPGMGLEGTGVTCDCDYMWTGPTCSHPCPYPYDEVHGICVVKDPSDSDYGTPWTAEVVCEDGWTGLPEENLQLAPNAPSRGRNCSMPCFDCVHGTCQDDGSCLCDYGYIWQGPLAETSDVGEKEPISPFPTVLYGFFYQEKYHTCAARHPCNMNGELFNATCGPTGAGYTDNLTAWTVLDPDNNGGYGCTGVIVNGTDCVDAVTGEPAVNLFAMAYAVWDAFVDAFVRTEQVKRLFSQWGQVQGGYCDVGDDELLDGQPFHGGYCVCDSIRNGRFKHPSATGYESKAYDYYFQGWAGAQCEIPCAPCSENGICNAQTGACDCHTGWAGFRCLTPCEPCDHGTCQYDGTCLCDGTRRLAEGTYALRLTRDPFYIERGEHVYEVQGERRSRYVHPVYMHTYDLEDYIWELEYECPNRAECRDRTPDTHLPTRPNETYFRYTTPNIIEVLKVNDELKTLQSYRDSLVTDVEGVPLSMAEDEVCEYTDVTNVVTKGKCIEKMRQRLFGRTMEGCGTEWDSVRPWDCDDVVKSHFVRERNLELGKVEVMSMKSVQSTEAENVWFANNVNERQRLINTMTRGRFNASTGEFETIRDPDYHMIWIVHQLIHGVASGDAYTGWQCDVKCQECDEDHGTCQYDGSCECAEGWYGPACDRRCDCYRHVAVKNALELRDQTEDVMLESVESHSGFPIQPHGTCQRDGTCRCYADPDGTEWTGKDCFTRCKPCSHGRCGSDGECQCDLGWTGDQCDTPRYVEAFPCDYDHGMSLSDGTCKCLRGYTGYDCSLACSPCVHGDCQMDGQCYCRPGWTLPDCSKKIWDGGVIRSDFSLSSEGWRVHNNSCPGTFEYVQGTEPDHGVVHASAIRGRCLGDGDGDGDSGLEWDGASGFLYLTDRLPKDGPGEIAYFRAPSKFLGDQLDNAYNATLAYELYLAGGGETNQNAAATPTTKHELGSEAEQAPDVVLVGGKPRHRIELPPWDIWDKHSVYEWSRQNFPELPLNLRWSKERLVRTVEAYLDTPQVVLGIRAARVPHYPPETCVAEHCSVNFNFDLVETAGWFNLPTIPQGFGWSDFDPDVDESADQDDRRFVFQDDGTKYVGKKQGSPYDPFAGVSREQFRSTGAAGIPSPDPAATVATRGDGGEVNFVWERGDGASVPNRGNPDLSEILKSVADAGGDPTSTRAVLDAIADPFKPGRMDTYWNKPGRQGAFPPGTYPGNGAFAGTWSKSESANGNDGGWRSARPGDERRRWDVLPEVYEAATRNRAARVGEPASFSDMAWCLASLTEVLIRADYYGDDKYRASGERFAATNAMGPGETVRLDHVMIAKKDPHTDPTHWLALEFANFMSWVEQYSKDYSVAYLTDYFADYNRTLRLSICSGNGVYRNGDPAQGCECYDDWLGGDCELACPACVNGACGLGPVESDGNQTAVCECQEGWAGTLCDIECPPCDYTRSSCATDALGQPSCACDEGYGGAYCQLDCPPCDYEVSSCGSTNYIGDFPGTAATCGCDDPTARVGILCELVCPQPNCGNGMCAHTLEGKSYDGTTVQQRAGDASFCRCDDGWVGTFCDDPCPGGPNHPTLAGAFPCLGRGTCALGSSGTAVCNCVTGYIGTACDQAIGVCGDGLVNVGEECDDGNANNLDGCDNGCRIEPNFRCESVPRDDVTPVEGVAASLISECTCPGILSPVLGCLVA